MQQKQKGPAAIELQFWKVQVNLWLNTQTAWPSSKAVVKEQKIEKYFYLTLALVSFTPGQSPRKQSTVSSHSPLHSEPPYEGPLHSLVLCMVPLEQEAEQELQLDHSFHTPSTEDGQGHQADRQNNTRKNGLDTNQNT